MNTITAYRAIEAQEIAANLESYLEYGAETRVEYLLRLACNYDALVADMKQEEAA